MNYDFKKFTDATTVEDILPAEAMNFNGKYFENEISGYRTLQVTGRELVGNTLSTLKVGNQDGERLQMMSRPAREITVKYQLDADSNAEFRDAFNNLNMLLTGRDNRIYFNDEEDKYFIGTLEDIDDVDGGSNHVVATFTILCNDPYKYAADEDEFSFSDGTSTKNINVDFNGKTYGNTSIVPHSIYTRYEPITVAMAGPSTYKDELDQANYSKLSERDNQLASAVSSSIMSRSVDNKYPKTSDSNDDGALDSIKLNGDNITFSGWHATNDSTSKPYHFIIVTNSDTSQEYGRIKVDLSTRADVGKVRPNIANSSKSGFTGTIPYVEGMSNKQVRVIFRYSTDAAGNENYTDWSAYAHTSESWQQTMPHMMIKFDVIQAMEQSEPGFWSKYGIYGRSEQLKWLKDALNSVKFKAWAYGKGYGGNNVTIKFWDNDTSWDGLASSNSSSPTLLERDFTEPANFFKYVDINGYVYINLYPEYDTTGNSTDSYVYMDYFRAEINIDLPTADALSVTNSGPLPVPIRFELTNHGDNGFIGIQGSNSTDMVLVGATTQQDGGIQEKSERLFSLDQTTTDLTKQFKTNIGTIPSNYHQTAVGSFYVDYTDNNRWRARTTRAGFGSGDGWHGPSLHRDFGADSEGVVGADNFTTRSFLWFQTNLAQAGLQSITLQGAAGEHLITVQIWSGINQNGNIKVIIGTKQVGVYEDNNNPRWNSFKGEIKINRSGNTYTVNINDNEGGLGTTQTVSYDDSASAKIKATGWTYQKAMYDNYEQISNMDLYDMWYQKDNVDSYIDIPNIFNDGDTIEIGGNERKVETTVNGAKFLTMQEVGSKPVLAYPGNNIISFMYSDFADRPDVKASIRKRYL